MAAQSYIIPANAPSNEMLTNPEITSSEFIGGQYYISTYRQVLIPGDVIVPYVASYNLGTGGAEVETEYIEPAEPVVVRPCGHCPSFTPLYNFACVNWGQVGSGPEGLVAQVLYAADTGNVQAASIITSSLGLQDPATAPTLSGKVTKLGVIYVIAQEFMFAASKCGTIFSTIGSDVAANDAFAEAQVTLYPSTVSAASNLVNPGFLFGEGDVFWGSAVTWGSVVFGFGTTNNVFRNAYFVKRVYSVSYPTITKQDYRTQIQVPDNISLTPYVPVTECIVLPLNDDGCVVVLQYEAQYEYEFTYICSGFYSTVSSGTFVRLFDFLFEPGNELWPSDPVYTHYFPVTAPGGTSANLPYVFGINSHQYPGSLATISFAGTTASTAPGLYPASAVTTFASPDITAIVLVDCKLSDHSPYASSVYIAVATMLTVKVLEFNLYTATLLRSASQTILQEKIIEQPSRNMYIETLSVFNVGPTIYLGASGPKHNAAQSYFFSAPVQFP